MAITLAEAITQVRALRWYNFDHYDGSGGIYWSRYRGDENIINTISHSLCFEWYDGPTTYYTLANMSELSAGSKARAKDMAGQLVRALVEYYGFVTDPTKSVGGGWRTYMLGFKEIYLDDSYDSQIRAWAGSLAYQVSAYNAYNNANINPSHWSWSNDWTLTPNCSLVIREFSLGVYGHIILKDVITPVAPFTEQIRDDYIYNVMHDIVMPYLDYQIDVCDNYTYSQIYNLNSVLNSEKFWPLYFFHCGRTLIEYYNNSFDGTLDAEILQKFPHLLDAWWDRFWLENDGNGNSGFNYSFTLDEANNLAAPDLSLLWAPLFAWVYSVTGDQTAKTRSLALYESGINGAWWAGSKVYQQCGIWSEAGFDWLAEDVPTPPTPDRVRLIIN